MGIQWPTRPYHSGTSSYGPYRGYVTSERVKWTVTFRGPSYRVKPMRSSVFRVPRGALRARERERRGASEWIGKRCVDVPFGRRREEGRRKRARVCLGPRDQGAALSDGARDGRRDDGIGMARKGLTFSPKGHIT